MPNSLMYQQDDYVVLETNQPEKFLTSSELLEKLKQTLQQLKEEELPHDLKKIDFQSRAEYLLNTSCELDIGAGQYLQWYAVRLEK
ncbi:chlororespiratory reduction protein 7 [Rivularia sp. UHCC 0363]|uniref:chlororespiratory reduction protein 7 n=1 Tax=Rivularia sp. UHCC 0363 TaxID=3110244 RepID=UPI002B20F747|nr:chlororespiratory reduction protein 7 [Rivularia sp. UHCC 0363]MEA5593954.1 chlororespiratory reduction protein 7 [Rivularia sp. UHCC 0363]